MANSSSRRIANDLRNLTVEHLRFSATPKELVQTLGISESSICRIRQTYNAFGTVDPTLWVKGRPKKIYTAAAEGMLDLMDQEPQASLAGFVDLLEAEYAVEVSKAAVSKKLKQVSQDDVVTS